MMNANVHSVCIFNCQFQIVTKSIASAKMEQLKVIQWQSTSPLITDSHLNIVVNTQAIKTHWTHQFVARNSLHTYLEASLVFTQTTSFTV